MTRIASKSALAPPHTASGTQYAAEFVDGPALHRVTFRHPQYAPGGRTSVRGNDTGGTNAAGSFQWSPVVRVLVAYLMRCAAWGRGERLTPLPRLEGGQGTPAASLSYAIEKKVAWLCDMFGIETSGRPHVENLFRQSNRALKRKKEPVVLCLEDGPSGLPPELISASLDGLSLEGEDALQGLADRIAGSCRPPAGSEGVLLNIGGRLADWSPAKGRQLAQLLRDFGLHDLQIGQAVEGSVLIPIKGLSPEDAEKLFWLAHSGELDALGFKDVSASYLPPKTPPPPQQTSLFPMTAPFLDDLPRRRAALPAGTPFDFVNLAIGQGNQALEVLVVASAGDPQLPRVRTLWKERKDGRAAPLVVAVVHPKGVTLCGPVGVDPFVHPNVEHALAERICREALAQPNRHAAIAFLRDALPAAESPLPGVRNEGFLATHQLVVGAPRLPGWNDAQAHSTPLLGLRDEDMLRSLGFTLEPCDQVSTLLRDAGGNKKVGVAVLLHAEESFEVEALRFNGLSPVSYALAVADREALPYVIICQGPRLRLYPVNINAGVGRRGRTETFVEMHTGLTADRHAAYLWLLFSHAALRQGGHLDELMEGSRRWAGELAHELRKRVYEQVVPALAKGIVAVRGLKEPTAADLADTYSMVMTVLFRLLFVAYAEDKDLLPYRFNGLYQRRSLKAAARELLDMLREQRAFGADSDSMWGDVDRLFRAVAEGNSEWGVPAYGGELFERDAAASRVGGLLADITLPNSVMGVVLRGLLLIETADGVLGPVDFRSLGVREFGTIYEGLLESELAVAETDLTVDKDGYYRPWKKGEVKVVEKGDVYLHNRSGARKATGTYFTKEFAVDHLLDHALEPALKDHAARVAKLDDADAAEQFFDFRVADIAMGSAHFLVAAVDRIERALTGYIAERRLPGVRAELETLRKAATDALGELAETVVIEDTQLLRRLIARRCIYGVDMNPVAVTLARLSIWVHTFVPGLPLSLLDHNLVCGNSLVGIGTVGEIADKVKEEGLTLLIPDAAKLMGEAMEPLKRLARAADANLADIRRARAALEEARKATAPAAALCDIVTAARIEGKAIPVALEQWDEIKAGLPESAEHRHARKVLSGLPPFHFPIAFPEVFLRERGGFDVLLGNPPWEKARVEEHGFWARHQPGLRSLSQRAYEQERAKFRETRPDLVAMLDKEVTEAETLRNALMRGPYPGMGTGDPDLYKAFCWRVWQLIAADEGRVSIVLPRSALAAKGSTEFRQALFSGGNVLHVTMLINNRQWVFDEIHPQYTIGLMVACKRPTGEGKISLLGPFASLGRYNEGRSRQPATFAPEEVAKWTDTVALPLLPAEGSLEVFTQLRKHPRLDLNDPTSWRARPYVELHATGDKGMMDLNSEERPKGFWPVYKGESFDIWEPDTGRYYAWADPTVVVPALQETRLRGARNQRSAFSELDAAQVRDAKTLPCHSPRIAFRDVSRATDSRTVRVALVPPHTFLNHLALCLLFPRGDDKDCAYLVGMLSSLPLDWYARRFVETHLTYAVFNPLPVPRPPRTSGLWQRAVALSGRLAAPDERFSSWAEKVGVKCGPLPDDQKQDHIHELDAVSAQLYGLSERQLVHVFETFHEGWDYSARLAATLAHFRHWSNKP